MKKNLLCFTLVFALMLLVSLPVSANDSLDSGVTPHVSYTEAYDVTSYNPFGDVPNMEYYSRAVLWAYKNNITKGTEGFLFSPYQTCTRGQTVTFLWRAMGEPMPGITKSPFRDVRDEVKDYYYNAVLWAYENGITEGTTSTTFSPDATVTRAQFVTFLWRAEGKPASSVPNPFGDLSFGGYYVNAVLWAVSNKITAGTSPITFSPDGPCERGQVVTFLYRDFMGNHAPTTVGRTYRLREDEYFQQFVVEPAGLRIGPGEEYHYIAKVAYNEIVDVMGFSTFDAGDVYHIGSPWSYVCFGGQYGWIESKKLSYEGSMREDTSCREEWNLANDFLPGTKYCAETGCSITFSNPEIVATSHYATFVYVDVTVETPAGDRYFDTCQILEKGDYTGDYWLYMHPQLSCGKISINFSDMQNEIFVAAEGFDLISGLYK